METVYEQIKFRRRRREYFNLYDAFTNKFNQEFNISKISILNSFKLHMYFNNPELPTMGNIKFYNKFMINDAFSTYFLHDLQIALVDKIIPSEINKFKSTNLKKDDDAFYFYPNKRVNDPDYKTSTQDYINLTVVSQNRIVKYEKNMSTLTGNMLEIELKKMYDLFDNYIILNPGFRMKFLTTFYNYSNDFIVELYSPWQDGYLNIGRQNSQRIEIATAFNHFIKSICLSYEIIEFELMQYEYLNLIYSTYQFAKISELKNIHSGTIDWPTSNGDGYRYTDLVEITLRETQKLPEYLYFEFSYAVTTQDFFLLQPAVLADSYTKIIPAYWLTSDTPQNSPGVTPTIRKSIHPFEIDMLYLEVIVNEKTIFLYNFEIIKQSFYDYMYLQQKEYYSSNDIFSGNDNTYSAFHFYLYKFINTKTKFDNQLRAQHVIIKYKAKTRALYNQTVDDSISFLNIYINERKNFIFHKNDWFEVPSEQKLIEN